MFVMMVMNVTTDCLGAMSRHTDSASLSIPCPDPMHSQSMNPHQTFHPSTLTRRALLASGACFASLAWAGPAGAAGIRSTKEAAAALADIEARSGGRLGLHAIDTGTGRTLGHRSTERFAMASTFKLLLAAAVLHHEDQAPGALEQRLPVRQADLIAHSPITAKHLQDGYITARQACQATVQVSDNGAANLLFPTVGGPAGLTAFLRESCQDTVTRMDRTEPTLNTNLRGDLRDTTTPQAMAATMRKLLTGQVLSTASRDQLIAWLEGATTGFARLRAGLPKDWRTGDKTGTGEHGAANDVAITWPTGRAPIVMAVYLSGSTQPGAVLDATHAQAAAVVASVLGA